MLGPFVPLAAKLGRLAHRARRPARCSRIAIEVYGELADHDTRLLTVAALNGAFQGHTDQPVNYVNAPVIAADRGIEVVEEKRRSSRDYTNLVAVAADGIRVAGTTIGTDDRHFLVSRARLRARDGARAAHGAPALRRHSRRDRPRRDAFRRRRREHREHDRVAEPRGRQGADGALDRLAAAAGARRPAPRGHGRGLRDHRGHVAWPEPVERVAARLRTAGVEARIEEFAEGTPTARDAAKAVGCELAQIVKSLVFVCDGAYVLALVPGDRRADEAAVAAAVPAQLVRVARPDEVVEATGFEPGGVAPFPQRAVISER